MQSGPLKLLFGLSLVAIALAQCGGNCPGTYEPVCANNGVTFANQCEFNLAQCQNSSLVVVSEGPCPDVAKGIFDDVDFFGDDTTSNSDDDNTELLWLALLLLLPLCSSSLLLPLLLGGGRGGYGGYGGGYGGGCGGCGGCGMMPYYRGVEGAVEGQSEGVEGHNPSAMPPIPIDPPAPLIVPVEVC